MLKGVTNTGLTEAVKAVPQVGALCSQAQTLTTQSNLLGTAVGGLSLNGALTVLGGLLDIPALPASLPAFTCPLLVQASHSDRDPASEARGLGRF